MTDDGWMRVWHTQMEIDAAAEMMERAVGWVTVSVDLEFGHLYIRGLYGSPEEALIAAARDEEEVNRGAGEGELGWKVVVHPVMP